MPDLSYSINQRMWNAIHDTGGGSRVVGMLEGDVMNVYLLGGEKFTWNPRTEEITTYEPYKWQMMPIDPDRIDKQLCRELLKSCLDWTKRHEKAEKWEEVRARFHIDKGRNITKKDQALIQKYLDSFKK